MAIFFYTSGKFLAVIIAAVKGRVDEAIVGVQIEAKRFSELILSNCRSFKYNYKMKKPAT